jgi:LDH2 family malate/lactate/ureidoglycolate dehydrogenase
MPTQSAATLRRLTQEIAEALGTPPDLAEAVVDSLVGANLAGHDSHGVIRVPWYAQLIRNGQIVPGARPTVTTTRGATARVDGASGWGQPTARLAAHTAIDLAAEHGVGAVVINNGNHIGRLGEYVEMIARAGKIGLMHCNASAIVAAFGGYQRVMGTNPFAWAAPAGPGREPLVLDFATSVVAEGKLRVSRAKGEKLAPGLIVDANGRPSENAGDFYEGGALLPFGLHKGSGMSVMIELLARGLTGVDHGLPSNQGYNGTVVLALDIAAFAPIEQFEAAATRLYEQIGGSAPMAGYERVLLPGEPERLARREREANGIVLPEATWNELTALAAELGVAVDTSR